MKKSLIGFSIVATMIISGCGAPAVDYTEFAQCLTANEMTFYGAFWCPHCHDQQEMFGDAFEHVDYVECDPQGKDAQPEVCLVENNITSYPTWIRGDGTRWEGTQSLEQLAEYSGCELPQEEVEESTEE